MKKIDIICLKKKHKLKVYQNKYQKEYQEAKKSQS